jgi:hypothetical protein
MRRLLVTIVGPPDLYVHHDWNYINISIAAIWRCIDTSEVLTIATAHSRHTVHPQLIAARGHRFFDRCYSIDALDHVSSI